MEKLWAGRAASELNALADDFNTSLPFDCRMYRQDIQGSMAHAAMLSARHIISESECEAILSGLEGILQDLDQGTLQFDAGAEDIHSFVEGELTARIGDPGRKLHTARSRNDQVALDLRLYLRQEATEIKGLLKDLILAVCQQAEENRDVIAPGYTHLQRAQPISFGHQLMAYAMMFLRDLSRLSDAVRRMNVSPIGACALAGTTYDTDRFLEAEKLGFSDVARNSIDAVSDRDFCVELQSALAIVMMHLSRFSEEVILWASWEFHFVELSDSFTTGSSIMPQKKNPDMAELCRGKTGRVYGNLMGTLTMLKGLPLAYNKDMQEDKEAIFDSVDTVKQCLGVFAPMIRTMKTLPETMRLAAQEGFINATDLADYLVGKGLPFRTAYKLVGGIVGKCAAEGKVLETLSLSEYQAFSPLFGEDLFDVIDLDRCMKRRTSFGGASPDSVAAQIQYVKTRLEAE